MLEVAVFYLAQNPDLQEKAFEEIQVGTLHVKKIWKCVQTIKRFFTILLLKIAFSGGLALPNVLNHCFRLQGFTVLIPLSTTLRLFYSWFGRWF